MAHEMQGCYIELVASSLKDIFTPLPTARSFYLDFLIPSVPTMSKHVYRAQLHVHEERS